MLDGIGLLLHTNIAECNMFAGAFCVFLLVIFDLQVSSMSLYVKYYKDMKLNLLSNQTATKG